MKLFSFISILPEELKTQYYKAIIKNGHADEKLWKDIIRYFEENYKKVLNKEEVISNLLKIPDTKEKSIILNLLEENNKNLFDKLSKSILQFEEIITLDTNTVKEILCKYNKELLVKATLATSPIVVNYLQSLFLDINFDKERKEFNGVPLNEIIHIQDDIIKLINNRLN